MEPHRASIRDGAATYIARHGRGYSCFEHTSKEITAELAQFVPINGAIKVSRLVLHNRSNRVRRLSVTAYVEWILGPSRGASLPFVITEINSATSAMFARNPWNMAFGSRTAFMDLRGVQTDWTGDRREFIGRNGTLSESGGIRRRGAILEHGRGRPRSLRRHAHEDRVVAEWRDRDRLLPRTSRGRRRGAQSDHLVRAADLDAVMSEVTRYWDDVLGAVQVKTPDRTMDIMLNGWLLYQTLACRVWARSAFYQASGAYGFRDQLQDCRRSPGRDPQ